MSRGRVGPLAIRRCPPIGSRPLAVARPSTGRRACAATARDTASTCGTARDATVTDPHSALSSYRSRRLMAAAVRVAGLGWRNAVEPVRHPLVDPSLELPELDRTVAAVELGYHGAVSHVEGGEQAPGIIGRTGDPAQTGSSFHVRVTILAVQPIYPWITSWGTVPHCARRPHGHPWCSSRDCFPACTSRCSRFCCGSRCTPAART